MYMITFYKISQLRLLKVHEISKCISNQYQVSDTSNLTFLIVANFLLNVTISNQVS